MYMPLMSAEVETLYVAVFEEDVIVRTHSESHFVYIESVPVVALYAPVITLSGLLDGARRILCLLRRHMVTGISWDVGCSGDAGF